MLVPETSNHKVDEEISEKIYKLTSINITLGFVNSSQAMLARFFSPPERPRLDMSPITVSTQMF